MPNGIDNNKYGKPVTDNWDYDFKPPRGPQGKLVTDNWDYDFKPPRGPQGKLVTDNWNYDYFKPPRGPQGSQRKKESGWEEYDGDFGFGQGPSSLAPPPGNPLYPAPSEGGGVYHKSDPTTEEPAQDDPTTEEPAQDDPTTEEPAQDDPTTEEPAQDDPTTEEQDQDPTGVDDLPAVATTPPPTAAPPPTKPAAPTINLPGGNTTRALGLNDDITEYARNWMAAPSRYDQDLVKQGMDVIKARMDRVRREGFQSAQAQNARSGLLQSTMGNELVADNRAKYDEQEQAQLFQMLREMAMTNAQDRSAAGNFGLNAGRFGEEQYRTDVDKSLRGRGLDLQQYGIDMGSYDRGMDRSESGRRFDADFGFRNQEADRQNAINVRAQDLQERGMDQDDAYRYAEMEFRKNENARDRDWRGGQNDRDRWLDLLRSMGLDGMDPSDFGF